MIRMLYLVIFIANFNTFFCDKKSPPDMNSIMNSKHTKDDKSVEFIHKIKEDLRRNNDDYTEAMAKTATNKAKFSNNLKLHYVKGNATLAHDGIRRAYEGSFSEEDFNSTDYTETETFTTDRLAKRFSKVTQATTKKLTKPTKIIKGNLNKFQLLFGRNEGLIKHFIGNRIQTTPPMTSTSRGTLRMKAVDSDQEMVLPSPDQLDMAPARGGRIHMQRIKGRLCQRNVLIPEGPKYDSKGQIYLPAFNPGPRKQKFENTLPPKFILPRCCNCCKKSVLGCE